MSESLSIVVPVFNEGAALDQLLQEIETSIVARLDGTRVVVVDDASTDTSGEILDRLGERLPWLTVDHAKANRGHGPTVCQAIADSQGSWIFQIDSDRQFDLNDFWQLWPRRTEYDLVLGVRAERQDPRHRLLLSRMVSRLIVLLTASKIQDPNIPFRLFRRSLWNDLQPGFPTPTLTPSILLTVGAVVTHARIIEIPVRHRARSQGTASLRSAKLLRFSLNALVQLVHYRVALAIKVKTKHSRHDTGS